MLKRSSVNRFYDKIHRGSVYICMGLTLYGGLLCATGVYNFFTKVKPALREQIEKENLELLKEGSSENLIDKAKLVA